MTRLAALFMTALISVSGRCAAEGGEFRDPPVAQAPAPPGSTLDPVVASPGLYRVLLENEYIRVVEYRIVPGERDNWHTHPAKVSYVVTPGKLRITTGDGRSFEVEEEAGTVRWLGSVGVHRGSNVGETPIKIVYVEIKGVQEQGDALRQFLTEEGEAKP